MPSRYLVANWKMNLPGEGISGYLAALNGSAANRSSVLGPRSSESRGSSTEESMGGGTEDRLETEDRNAVQIIVAPPYPYLREISTSTSLPVAAQNCADHERGAYTGEVSAQMVRERGARFVILGHSERRNLYGESDAVVARKLAIAIAQGLTPILCIGEELRIRDSGQVAMFLAGQLRAAAEALVDDASEILLAYEPVWAIGTGRNASGLMVAETVEMIRESLARFWPARYEKEAPVLYGGSVTTENVQDLETHGHVDGYLVGGACLESPKLLSILGQMRR